MPITEGDYNPIKSTIYIQSAIHLLNDKSAAALLNSDFSFGSIKISYIMIDISYYK